MTKRIRRPSETGLSRRQLLKATGSTAALLAAAKDAEAGKEGAGAALTKAVNCMACHSAHKGA